MIFQHSDLWRRLRYSLDRERRSYSGSLVAVTSNCQGSGQLCGSEDDESGVPIEGRSLLRKVLRQLITSVAFLHERGTVHRGELIYWFLFPTSALILKALPSAEKHRHQTLEHPLQIRASLRQAACQRQDRVGAVPPWRFLQRVGRLHRP